MADPERPVTRASLLLKILVITLSLAAVAAQVWCGYAMRDRAEARRQHKLAYAFVNNVSFGLLSVDVWRDQVVETARKELNSFRLTPEQERSLRKEIDRQLYGLVDQAFADINKPKKSLGDKLKKAAVNALVDQKEVEAEIPGFSKRMMTVLTSPASYKRVTNIADTAIAQISRKIYDSSVASTKHIMDSIYKTYGATDKEGFERNNARVTKALSNETKDFTWLLTGCSVFLLLLWILVRKNTWLRAPVFVFATVSALILLLVGISTTIIEIDATLSKMDIQFLSGSLSFKSQSLFFQSQSLLDVTRLLLSSKTTASIIVGLMIAIFCILFPLVILVAACMAVSKPGRWKDNFYVDYFAFHATKWNMSDVMLVGILMTYIGFNGIVDSTLSTLNYTEGSITSVTDNNTALEAGFFVYAAFVVVSFTLVYILKKQLHPVQEAGRVGSITFKRPKDGESN